MSDISIETAPYVIQTCINLRGSENFYESMKVVIADIQKQTDSFCSCIIMIDKERQKYATLCSKFSDENVTIEDFEPYLTPDVVFSWEDTLKNHDMVIIKDDYDMAELAKQNPIWAKSLRGAGVKSLLLVPLSQGKKMFGVLFISNFDVERIVELKEFIELTAFFLSSSNLSSTEVLPLTIFPETGVSSSSSSST